MSLNQTIQDEEKAQLGAIAGAGGVTDEPNVPQPPTADTTRDWPVSQEQLSNGEESQTQDDARDMEALAAVRSGPAYSSFSRNQKRYIIFMVSWAGFFSPLSANIYFPALNTLARDLNRSNQLINLTLTSYMIFQGLAPTVFGDLADMGGRRPAYILCFVIYMGANIGLALQNTYPALFLLRCLQSTGSSGTIALGNGVVGDVATSSERGTYIGWAVAGPMIGPAIGPIIGGVLSQFLGWRAIFWFLTIMAGVYLIPFLITYPETGRNIVGDGSIPPQGWNMSLLNYLKVRKDSKTDGLNRTVSREQKRLAQAHLASQRKLRFPNPLKTIHIILEKDVGMILFYNSLIYTAFYDVISTIPSLFQEIYGYNDLQIGLCYIPFGVGCCAASILSGRAMDWNYKRVARNAGIAVDRKRGEDMKDFPLERARIQVIWPQLMIGIAAIFCYGWVLQQEASLAAPLILTFIIGLTLTGAFNVLSTMLVDLYPMSPATATAANNLVRCLMGAAGTAIIQEMIHAMGRGPCFSFIAAVVFVTSPMLWVDTKWGPQWREERRLRVDKHKAEKENKKETQRLEAEGPAGGVQKET
ncbi:MAG: hypothetical protein M1827_003833 [Pycnora praestabilis]|nr:MAG: hypothetical protein M1827_003833 [Pycnora praestabilis]